MKVILASASLRRHELLKQLDIPFDIVIKDTEEKLNKEKSCEEQCMDIAKAKALNVYQDYKEDVIVIGSDTMVIYDNKIYGKPHNYNEAFEMLKLFNNHTHKVISSLCLLVRKDGQEYEELTYDECYVTFSEMTDDEINDWINNHSVYDKAGAYAIQEGFGKYISKIEGDYFSIVGLPLYKTYNLIKKYYKKN